MTLGGIKRFTGGMEGDQSSPVVYKGGTKKIDCWRGGGGWGVIGMKQSLTGESGRFHPDTDI